MSEEEHELFFKTASDYIMNQGRNAWIMPFPQTIIKIKPKKMASVPYITTDISYLKWNISKKSLWDYIVRIIIQSSPYDELSWSE